MSLAELIWAGILALIIGIWFFMGLIWSFMCIRESDDIKEIMKRYFWTEAFRKGNWFGKILIILWIIILLPHIIFGMVLCLVMFICYGIYYLIQKMGGWDK